MKMKNKQSVIEVKNISYSYGKNEILKDISFDVEAGECVAVLGNNGAGKSTLITCINKIRTPETGSVYIDGQDILKMSRVQTARYISYVAQKNETSQMTVFDSVLLGRKPYIKWGITQGDIDICEAMIAQLGLSDLKLRYIDELSGGELQKVMIARALVQEPKLLLLDEPANNLDPKNQHDMLVTVRELVKSRNISAVIVLHDISLALRYCDKFLFIKAGRVCKYGGEEVVCEETIFEVYGIKSVITEVNGQKIAVIG